MVAWQDNASGSFQVFLKRWDGVQWSELAGSAGSSGLSLSTQTGRSPTVATETGGNPVVAWSDNGPGNYEIYLRRWDGTQWASLGGSAAGGGVSNLGIGVGSSYNPSLALDGSNNPVLAWEMASTGLSIWSLYLKRWDGTQWVELGSSASGSGIANTGVGANPSVAVDATGNPVVAWQDGTSGNLEIYLKRWDGTQWVELGGSASGGGVSNSAGFSENPSLVLDAAGNPIVAWNDGTPGNLEIYLKRWNGTAWVELGGSATGGGVSNTAGLSAGPSLALDSAGNPVVAWNDDTPGNLEIYLKRWNGTAWVELGGSATGGGISNTTGASDGPSLKLEPTGNPVVAWRDDTPGSSRIYLRRWNGTVWLELGGSASGGGLSD